MKYFDGAFQIFSRDKLIKSVVRNELHQNTAILMNSGIEDFYSCMEKANVSEEE